MASVVTESIWSDSMRNQASEDAHNVDRENIKRRQCLKVKRRPRQISIAGRKV